MISSLLDMLDPPDEDLDWALTQRNHTYTLHLRSPFGDPGKWSDWRPYDSLSWSGWSVSTQKHTYARFYYKHDYGTDLNLRIFEYETEQTTVDVIEYDYKEYWWSKKKERSFTRVEKAYRIRHRPTRKHDLTHVFEFAGSGFSRPPSVEELRNAASALLAVYDSLTEETEKQE